MGAYARGSLGFGEEALQSLPGNIGTQDVNDVLAAIDDAIQLGLADASKICVLGGSHGGFLSTHLIGQVHQIVINELPFSAYVFVFQGIVYKYIVLNRLQISLQQQQCGILSVILL